MIVSVILIVLELVIVEMTMQSQYGIGVSIFENINNHNEL